MSEWTKQRLEQMISDGIEENLSLDYKGADSLAKTDLRRTEITKDVSSFANSSGGVLIYGIAEFNDPAKRHLPERLDPLLRTEFSKESLDQVIQMVRPRIEGVVIHPVPISEQDITACYVVEVPQSDTAHMARDHRYYKRHNFTTLAMEDYEVRDVMNRGTYPRIRGFIFVNRNTSRREPEGMVLVRLENIGRVIARDVMVELELPLDMNGLIQIEQPVLSKTGEEGSCHHFRLIPDLQSGPIFPGSDITIGRKFSKNVRDITNIVTGASMSSTRHVKISIFADEMPAIRATLDIAPVLLGWTPVQNADATC
jgi:hypothetical protein